MEPSTITSSLIFSVLFLLIQSATADTQENKIRYMESETCGECHEEIYAQWQGSMHAKSTALKDPIHATFYKKVVGDPLKEGVKKGGKYPVCLQCHAPAAAKDGKTKQDMKTAYGEGVNCVACHSLTQYKGVKHAAKPGLNMGMKAYEFSDVVLQGPSGSDKKKRGHGNSKLGVVNNPGLF